MAETPAAMRERLLSELRSMIENRISEFEYFFYGRAKYRRRWLRHLYNEAQVLTREVSRLEDGCEPMAVALRMNQIVNGWRNGVARYY